MNFADLVTAVQGEFHDEAGYDKFHCNFHLSRGDTVLQAAFVLDPVYARVFGFRPALGVVCSNAHRGPAHGLRFYAGAVDPERDGGAVFEQMALTERYVHSVGFDLQKAVARTVDLWVTVIDKNATRVQKLRKDKIDPSVAKGCILEAGRHGKISATRTLGLYHAWKESGDPSPWGLMVEFCKAACERANDRGSGLDVDILQRLLWFHNLATDPALTEGMKNR